MLLIISYTIEYCLFLLSVRQADIWMQTCSQYAWFKVITESVMWIRIDRMRIRIHKIWWILIQDSKITNWFQTIF